ncbi:unnamed protein product [Anisakis simplex]|uniref:MORN repeat-containing protein n=1 Tax=Anisakis simplex TaxID=6269 RepID=A0A0M3K9L5_ANISI|nr:unnamed protein product [Anisakis simplex]
MNKRLSTCSPSAISPSSAVSEWCVRWRLAEQQLEHLGALADRTFSFWRRPNRCNEHNLKAANRLLLWCADTGQEQCQVKNLSVIKPKSYLPNVIKPKSYLPKWSTLAVFNDSVGIVEKGDLQLYKFPLIWAEPLIKDDRHMVRLYTPEDELHIEFTDAAAKSDFLQACHQWRTFGRRYARRRHRGGDSFASAGLKKRFGEYVFSAAHPTFKNCIYEGGWLCGEPHGRGRLKYPDRKEYKGHFECGIIEGFGELTVPIDEQQASVITLPRMNSVFFTNTSDETTTSSSKVDVYTGCWHNGQINGLVSIRWANGDTYEGYMRDGQRHGHGVQRYCTISGEQQIYVGGWRSGMRHGYGVNSSNRERYLGMWQNDVRQGNGAIVSIDGAYHEGLFEKDRLVYGRLLCHAVDGEFGKIYEGDFDKTGMISGKGVLQLSKYDRIEGQMSGNLMSGDLKISNAVLKKCPPIATDPLTPVGQTIYNDEPSVGQWTVPCNVKWKEMFEHFLSGDLRIEAQLEEDIIEYDTVIGGDQVDSTAVWRSLAGTMTAIRNGINTEKLSFTFDDRLEKIPNFHAPWSNTYYAMVVDYWRAVNEFSIS